MGIEPTYQAWKASVLPLNYARNKTALYYTKKKLPKEDFPGSETAACAGRIRSIRFYYCFYCTK